ncbi:unnamed protein product [Cyclocybe aegerita]|uniref:Uncharacterized protein n=1 Tax=Cyclocybe aegerita TaxID=1973307 RepID=A0A8S0WT58_CYCAE|nr:unnamed protein product [Cyclocybe aegerita]
MPHPIRVSHASSSSTSTSCVLYSLSPPLYVPTCPIVLFLSRRTLHRFDGRSLFHQTLLIVRHPTISFPSMSTGYLTSTSLSRGLSRYPTRKCLCERAQPLPIAVSSPSFSPDLFVILANDLHRPTIHISIGTADVERAKREAWRLKSAFPLPRRRVVVVVVVVISHACRSVFALLDAFPFTKPYLCHSHGTNFILNSCDSIADSYSGIENPHQHSIADDGGDAAGRSKTLGMKLSAMQPTRGGVGVIFSHDSFCDFLPFRNLYSHGLLGPTRWTTRDAVHSFIHADTIDYFVIYPPSISQTSPRIGHYTASSGSHKHLFGNNAVQSSRLGVAICLS